MPATNFVIVSSTDGSSASLQDKVASVKQIDGCDHVFYGQQIEHPSTSVLVAVWSPSSSDNKDLLAETIANPAAQIRTVQIDSMTVLQAPTTEVVTAYGIEDGFEKNVRDFAGRVDAEKPAGYHGAAVGRVSEEISKEAGGAKGPAAMLVIGWDSKEAHVEAKSKPGAILDNINLIRELRKDMDMFHVSLKQA